MKKTAIILLCVMLLSAITVYAAANELYYDEISPWFNNAAYNISTPCPSVMDWDGDGLLDIVGGTLTNSTAGTTFTIMKNTNNNTNPVFTTLYEHGVIDWQNGLGALTNLVGDPYLYYDTDTANFDADCVEVGDLDQDGDNDIIFFDYDKPPIGTSTNSRSIDNYQKYGLRMALENTGTNAAPAFTENLDLIASMDYEISFYGDIDYLGQARIVTHGGIMRAICANSPGGACLQDLYFGESALGEYLNTWFDYNIRDYDFDGDPDIIVTFNGNNDFWENYPDAYGNPHFVNIGGETSTWEPDIYNPAAAGVYWVDWQGNGTYSILWGAKSGIAANLKMRFSQSVGWTDINDREYIINFSTYLSQPFAAALGYEPQESATSFSPVFVGAVNGDQFQDIVMNRNGDTYILYLGESLGNVTPYAVETVETCDYPCIADEDFNDYSDGTQLNTLSGWIAADCVTIDSGSILINGSCTTSRVCNDLYTTVTVPATVLFNVSVYSSTEARYSQYFNSFDGLSHISGWQDTLSSLTYNSFYVIPGDLVPKDFIYQYINRTWYSHGLQVYPSDKNVTVSFNTITDNRPFFTGSSADGFRRLCWNVQNTTSAVRIDDLKVTFGTAGSAASDLVVNSSISCFGPICYDSGGLLGDNRPSTYEQQKTQIGGAWLNWDRCLEAGYKPNLLCVPKLFFRDIGLAIKNWFLDNIVIWLLIIMIMAVLSILWYRGRGGGE